jgi:hypothetical protein
LIFKTGKGRAMTWISSILYFLRFISSPAMMQRTHPASVEVNADQRAETAQDDLQSWMGADRNHGHEFLFLPALLYLLLPSAIVLFYFSAWPVLVVCATGLAILWAGPQSKIIQKQQPNLLSNTWPYLIMSAGIVWLSGAMPPFAENSDWFKHYAIFNTLSDQPWPPKIATDNGIATLRYSLSYYVFPAAAVKILGSSILPFAIFAWTTLGLYAAMILAFGWTARPIATIFTLSTIFFLFSGADIIGTKHTGVLHGPLMHFEWWWKPFGSLSSIVTNLFWAPQHAVAGLLSAFLVLRYPRRSMRNAGVILAATAVWSPFAAIGLAPVFIWSTFQAGFRDLFTRSNLIAAPILLLASALFLTQGSGGIPAEFLSHMQGFTIKEWLIFLIVEFGAIALALFLATPQRAMLIFLQVAFLTILSLFHVGLNNDLLMRASIPSLGILALLSSTAVVYAPNNIRKAPLIILLVLGLATPLGEIMRSITTPRIENKGNLTIEKIIRDDKRLAPQYITYGKPSDAIIN